jgi:hypothetical protein
MGFCEQAIHIRGPGKNCISHSPQQAFYLTVLKNILEQNNGPTGIKNSASKPTGNNEGRKEIWKISLR